MKKNFYRVSKKIDSVVSTAYGPVEFSKVFSIDVSCDELEPSTYHTGVSKNDRLRIVKGRKFPIGTEGIVKVAVPNKFGSTFNDVLTGRLVHLNPSILLVLDDGSEIWTCGDNCINLKYGEPAVFTNEEDVNDWEKANTTSYGQAVWYFDGREVIRAGNSLYGLSSEGFGVYQKMIKEGKSEIAAVIDDFSTDRYMFVKFTKEAKQGNAVQLVSTGSIRNMDDMWRGDTGLADAIKAFEDCQVA